MYNIMYNVMDYWLQGGFLWYPETQDAWLLLMEFGGMYKVDIVSQWYYVEHYRPLHLARETNRTFPFSRFRCVTHW